MIDDASRFGGDREKSKAAYEEGMSRAFLACHRALAPEGRLVVVFANKQPAAWETLVSFYHPGRLRGGRQLAHSDGDGQPHPGPGIFSFVFFSLAGRQEAPGSRPGGVG